MRVGRTALTFSGWQFLKHRRQRQKVGGTLPNRNTNEKKQNETNPPSLLSAHLVRRKVAVLFGGTRKRAIRQGIYKFCCDNIFEPRWDSSLRYILTRTLPTSVCQSEGTGPGDQDKQGTAEEYELEVGRKQSGRDREAIHDHRLPIVKDAWEARH